MEIIDIKVVGFCSKCRKETDEIPKTKEGLIVSDKDISCINKTFVECKGNLK